MAFPVLAGAAGVGFWAMLQWAIRRALLWFFIAKGAAVIARLFGALGLAVFTYQFVIEPAVQMVDANVANLPPQLGEWLSALGIFEVMSIIVSGYVLLAAKRVFLGRSA